MCRVFADFSTAILQRMAGSRMLAPMYVAYAALLAFGLAVAQEDGADPNEHRLQPLRMTADQETVRYLLPKLTAKYRPDNEWNGVTDPRFYLLTEMDTPNEDLNYENELSQYEGRTKRAGLTGGPSLSIVNSLDVLRNRLLLEIARKKQMEGMSRNRNLLSSVGKRAIFGRRGGVFGV